MDVSAVDIYSAGLLRDNRHCADHFTLVAKAQIALRLNALERVGHNNDQFVRTFYAQRAFLPANSPAARSQNLIVAFQFDCVGLIT